MGFWVLWGTDEEEEQGERQGVEQRGRKKGKMKDPSEAPLMCCFIIYIFYFDTILIILAQYKLQLLRK